MSDTAIEMTDAELMDRLRAIARQRQQQPLEAFRIPLETHSEWIAADRIASLKAENDRLREALKPFAAIPPVVYSATDESPLYAAHYWAVVGHPGKSHFTREHLARAREFLAKTETSNG